LVCSRESVEPDNRLGVDTFHTDRIYRLLQLRRIADGRLGEQFGKLLIGAGLTLAFIGLLVIMSSKLPWLRLGRLPGDINVHRDGFSLFIPITTMILLSAVLSAVMFLIGRFRR